jgi:hypothetical protein
MATASLQEMIMRADKEKRTDDLFLANNTPMFPRYVLSNSRISNSIAAVEISATVRHHVVLSLCWYLEKISGSGSSITSS